MATEKPGIYIIRHVPTGRVYVGSASNISKRWSRHRKDLRAGIHRNAHLQAAWTKYGEEAFGFEIVELTSDLDLREQFWMDHHRAYEQGFNLCPVARSSRGRRWSEEERAKHYENGSPARYMYAPEVLARRRAGLTARNDVPSKLSPEQKREARERYGEPTPHGKGRKMVKNGGISMKLLAGEYGVSVESMWRVLRGGDAQ